MATIADVAKAAGVSSSTVSYVLSGKRPISQPTRHRVEKAIRDLGFSPHAGARALASSRTNVLGLVVPLRALEANSAVVMEVVTGVLTRARDFDHDVLVLTQDDVHGVQRLAAGSMVDALILMDIETQDPRLPVLAGLRQPSILVGVPSDAHGLSCVDLDFTAAGRLAVRHLVEHGHRSIALLGAPTAALARSANYAVRIVEGFRSQAGQAGVRHTVVPTEATYPGADAAVTQAFAELDDLTALVVHNEAALPGVLAALARDGRRVPDDVSVLAVAPASLAEHLVVPLSAIDVPAEEIGRAAVEMAIERLDQPRAAETRLLAPTFVERGSCAAPA
ncbi:LacI family DNA-binding transcriptional regulator [Cellulomonas biazotea]|jgi:DNA-binding LacI/PurR family transcriptional regulator|uniref:LacI family transcriptional regulator n=1 Tax=Cellulomonas biazotea TaxID=1709 RepID=A0A402DT10_9CELL|nr:LacI family DNA-binding transcriptional regulator [Cellulomonas biazotea]GCE77279.1 LacI family transcriptional regulator [Cellulomonas biazotea]